MKNLLPFIVVMIGALGFLAVNDGGTMRAQQVIAPPAVVVANAPVSQYRVIDIGRIPVAQGQSATGTLELMLNEQAAQGWKVCTTTGNFIILMQ